MSDGNEDEMLLEAEFESKEYFDHALLPVRWDGSWDDFGDGEILYNVEFTADFGMIHKGDKFASIAFNHTEGRVEVYDETGKISTHAIKVKLIPSE